LGDELRSEERVRLGRPTSPVQRRCPAVVRPPSRRPRHAQRRRRRCCWPWSRRSLRARGPRSGGCTPASAWEVDMKCLAICVPLLLFGIACSSDDDDVLGPEQPPPGDTTSVVVSLAGNIASCGTQNDDLVATLLDTLPGYVI